MKPEAATQKAILDYLAVMKIWRIRMNSGAVVSTYKGKTRMLRFGRSGCADILAAPRKEIIINGRRHIIPQFLWIECKSPTGQQSLNQKEFQKEVEAEGHHYLTARSIEDVENYIKEM